MQDRDHAEEAASGDGLASPAERRHTRQEVRDCFEEASALVAAFFDPARQWGTLPNSHQAMLALRERFGHLTSTELLIMLGGIARMYERRRVSAQPPVPASST